MNPSDIKHLKNVIDNILKEWFDHRFIIFLLLTYVFHNVIQFVVVKLKQYRKSTAKTLYNSNCPVCLNDLDCPVKAECGHGFCFHCLKIFSKDLNDWKWDCPYCRVNIKNLDFVENEAFKALPLLEQTSLRQSLKGIVASHRLKVLVWKGKNLLEMLKWLTPALLLTFVLTYC